LIWESLFKRLKPLLDALVAATNIIELTADIASARVEYRGLKAFMASSFLELIIFPPSRVIPLAGGTP
jgi:hypothetical protein